MAYMIIFVALCIVSLSTTTGEIHKRLGKRFDKDTDTDYYYSTPFEPTTAERYTTGSTPVTTSSPTLYCDRQYSCLNNCSTVRLCAPTADGKSLYEFKRFTCPSTNPYCNPNTGTCSYAQSDSSCSSPPVASNFTCMRNGYFPDPNNCSRYYVCQDEVAYMYTCQSPSPYYSVSSQSCVSYSYYCSNYYYSCNGRSGVKIGTSWYPNNIFTYCYNNTAVAVDRCIGAYQFNQNTQTCVATCPHAGLFPRDDDCTRYYKCSPTTHNPQDNTFIMTNMTCPQGQGFSEKEYQCVDESLAPNCNVPNSGLFNKK